MQCSRSHKTHGPQDISLTLSLRCTASLLRFSHHYPTRLNGLTHSHGRYCYALGRQNPTIAMFDELRTVRINSLTLEKSNNHHHNSQRKKRGRRERQRRIAKDNQPTTRQPAKSAATRGARRKIPRNSKAGGCGHGKST